MDDLEDRLIRLVQGGLNKYDLSGEERAVRLDELSETLAIMAEGVRHNPAEDIEHE